MRTTETVKCEAFDNLLEIMATAATFHQSEADKAALIGYDDDDFTVDYVANCQARADVLRQAIAIANRNLDRGLEDFYAAGPYDRTRV